MMRTSQPSGISLLELILYIGLMAIILSLVAVFFATVLQGRAKQQTIAEVEQQGNQAMEQITQAIRNATTVTSPTLSDTASSLSLTAPDASNSPTVISMANDALTIKEGNAAAVALTSAQVRVTGLLFSNFGNAGTKGSIHVQFTISYNSPSTAYQYSFSQIFYAAATVK